MGDKLVAAGYNACHFVLLWKHSFICQLRRLSPHHRHRSSTAHRHIKHMPSAAAVRIVRTHRLRTQLKEDRLTSFIFPSSTSCLNFFTTSFSSSLVKKSTFGWVSNKISHEVLRTFFLAYRLQKTFYIVPFCNHVDKHIVLFPLSLNVVGVTELCRSFPEMPLTFFNEALMINIFLLSARQRRPQKIKHQLIYKCINSEDKPKPKTI